MSILKVSRMGHPVLRQRAAGIAPEQLHNPRLQQLIDDMFETLDEYEGIGLAAPQVFQPVRLVVLGLKEPDPDRGDRASVPRTALLNPEWVHRCETVVEGWEGCLSVPGLRGLVPRAETVHLRGLGRHGRPLELEADGLFARVLQHEIDHLDGLLYLDRMQDMRSLAFLEEYERYWMPEGEEDEGED